MRENRAASNDNGNDHRTMRDIQDCNRCRYEPAAPVGHYESWFQRANHPTRPLAFWIRYTIFSPKGRPGEAVGELWAIWFDGETGRHVAVKEVVPIERCRFSPIDLDARIGMASLTQHRLEGRVRSAGRTFRWHLDYDSDEPMLLLLPRRFYDGGFPNAKALVGSPNAIFHGTIAIDGQRIAIDGWRGSQNHNWGSRHTDAYAWGQVAGFDGAPHTFLECATAHLRIGGLPVPASTLVVLRVEGREHRLNGLLQSMRSTGRFDFFTWTLEARSAHVRVTARLEAPASAFVGLRYANPPGGSKTCLNTKIAACELTLEHHGETARTFVSKHGAAFEILTERADHGVGVVA